MIRHLVVVLKRIWQGQQLSLGVNGALPVLLDACLFIAVTRHGRHVKLGFGSQALLWSWTHVLLRVPRRIASSERVWLLARRNVNSVFIAALLVRHRVNVLQRLVAAIAILLRPTSIIGIVIHHAVALPVQGTRQVAVWCVHHVHLLVQLVISFDLALARSVLYLSLWVVLLQR